jgi:hypothetical protein
MEHLTVRWTKLFVIHFNFYNNSESEAIHDSSYMFLRSKSFLLKYIFSEDERQKFTYTNGDAIGSAFTCRVSMLKWSPFAST